jgi:hypothetical protein
MKAQGGDDWFHASREGSAVIDYHCGG